MAPTYAVLVIGFLEKQLYKKCEDKYGKAERKNFIKEFKRFSDDYFLYYGKDQKKNFKNFIVYWTIFTQKSILRISPLLVSGDVLRQLISATRNLPYA